MSSNTGYIVPPTNIAPVFPSSSSAVLGQRRDVCVLDVRAVPSKKEDTSPSSPSRATCHQIKFLGGQTVLGASHTSFLGRARLSDTLQKLARTNQTHDDLNALPLSVKSEAIESPSPAKKLSKNEPLKEKSKYLKGNLADEFAAPGASISEPATQLLKFHGSYMQDDRELRAPGQEKAYQFFLRTRNPGGVVPAQLYLALDKLSETYGNGTLRATTRQAFQLHGVLKHELKTVIKAIVDHLGSTQGACGDINRNVMSPAAPFYDRPEYITTREWARHIADLLRSQGDAYAELWLDGEKVWSLVEEAEFVTAARNSNGTRAKTDDPVEPIYGTTYLPRKFKIALTVPGDNSVDIYTQDIGMVAISDAQGELEGFNLIVGGGMGRTHKKEDSYPRVGDHLGYIAKDKALLVVKAIVAVQRDHGNREVRRNARMKYTIDRLGLARFKELVEDYAGFALEPFRPLPAWRYEDYLGWHSQGDGNLFFGLQIENGRVKDSGSFRLKSALREIVSKFDTPMRMTPHQNVLLVDIKPEWRDDIAAILKSHGIPTHEEKDLLVRKSMACPALPLCGLAITEAERGLPAVLDRIRAIMTKVGIPKSEGLVIRMTGCPNGCARPYMSELGFVGDGPDAYQLWLGGSAGQTRLAWEYKQKVALADLEKVIEPLFAYYIQDRLTDEGIGDFWDRKGAEALDKFAATYAAAP